MPEYIVYGYCKHGKPKSKLKYLIPLFCVILILASYLSFSIGYNIGAKTTFNKGYELGYMDGFSAGNQTGYMTGYHKGDSIGYGRGYTEGNATGYKHGYDLGYREGDAAGYETGFKEGNITGFDKGYLKGVIDGAGRGWNIRDPTYREMLDFIARDQTDQNEYIAGEYYCWHFASDVKLNAFKAGYRCGLVYIEGTLGAHAIICFNTTDKGIIFIEPQTDEIVQLTIGESYKTSKIWLLLGTIKSYAIVW